HLDRVAAAVADLRGIGLNGAADALEQAVATTTEATTWLLERGAADPRDALAGATPYLRMLAVTTGGWLMARQALAATRRAEAATDAADRALAEGKLATARFFLEQRLGEVTGLLPQVVAGAAPLLE